MTALFHVNLADRRDLSGQIYRHIRQAVLDGGLRPGDRLPPIRELAQSLSVSRMTVSIAYDRLKAEGFVSARVGAGTEVRANFKPGPKPENHARGHLQPRSVWTSIPLSTAFDVPARFDFRTGLPDLSLFPGHIWRRYVARSARSTTGPYKHPAGDEQLRTQIARHVGLARGVRTSADEIVITNGTQQALDIVTRTLLSPGDRIAVEDPGYQPSRYLFQSLGCQVIGVPVDSEGLVVDALRPDMRAVYVTPSHQYPLGMVMSLERRQALLAWASRNNAAIIEDDYDAEFRFGGRPVEPLRTLDATGCVIYIGSFSKTLHPDLRLGYLVCPPSLVPAIHRAKYVTDWYTATTLQSALAEFIRAGEFARYVRKVGAIYKERHRILTQVIADTFSEVLDLVPSETGLHVAALSSRHSVEQISAIKTRGLAAQVAFQPLSVFAVGRDVRAGLVLGYGAVNAHQIREGLCRLRTCFD